MRPSLVHALRWLVIALCLIAPSLVIAPSVAFADDTIRLNVADATARCASEDDIRSELAARVGQDRVDPESPREVRVAIERVGRELVAQITIVTEGVVMGRRELRAQGRACDDLVEDVLLTLSLIVETPIVLPSETSGSDSGSDSDPDPDPDSEADPDPDPEADPDADADADPEMIVAPRDDLGGVQAIEYVAPQPKISLRYFLAAGVSLEALPNPAWAIEVGLMLPVGALRVALSARYTGNREMQVAPGSVRTTLIRVRAFAGYAWHSFQIGFVGAAGALIASGHNFDESSRVTRASVGIGPHLALQWRALPRLHLRLFGEVLLGVVDTDVNVDTETVWSSGPVSASLGVGVVWGR